MMLELLLSKEMGIQMVLELQGQSVSYSNEYLYDVGPIITECSV